MFSVIGERLCTTYAEKGTLKIMCAPTQSDQGLELIDRFVIITKIYRYNFDPLKSQFYIVKLEFTRVYIIFLISAQKHRLWVLVRTASARRF